MDSDTPSRAEGWGRRLAVPAALLLLAWGAGPAVAPAVDPVFVPGLCEGPFPVSFRIPLSTGVAPDGSVLPVGAPDPAWRLRSYPQAHNSQYGPGPAYSRGADPWNTVWAKHPALATGWINQAPLARHGFSGSYEYERLFEVPYFSSNVFLDVSYAADDSVFFYVDQMASQTSLPIGSSPPAAWKAWQSFPSVALSQKGPHRLVAVVENTLVPPGSPTGLDAEVILTGTCDSLPTHVDPCAQPGDFRVPLGTGLDAQGNLLAPSVKDPFWHLRSFPFFPNGVDGPGPAYSHGPTANAGPWASNPDLDTGWINHDALALAGYDGTYVYDRYFDVPVDTVSVYLYLGHSADDGVAFHVEELATQTLTPAGGTPPPNAQAGWHVGPGIPIAGKGLHRLVAIVTNEATLGTGVPVETGLNVDAVLTGGCL